MFAYTLQGLTRNRYTLYRPRLAQSLWRY